MSEINDCGQCGVDGYVNGSLCLGCSRSGLEHAVAIASAALTFGQIQRATLHPDGTPESDATHTVMLAMLVAELAQREGLDVGLAVQFAIVHDLPETYAGDTCTARALSPDEAAAKTAREAASLERLRGELGPCWTTAMIDRYEAQREPEARLVRYADKILPKLTHALNRGDALAAIDMTTEEIERCHAAQGEKLRGLYPEMHATRALFDDACALALGTFRARPSAPMETPTVCGDECDGMHCELPRGHAGEHEGPASDGSGILEQWQDAATAPVETEDRSEPSTMILGIDPGINCGFAVLDNDGTIVSSGVWTLPGKDAHDGARWLHLYDVLSGMIALWPEIDLLAYERVEAHGGARADGRSYQSGASAGHSYGGLVAIITLVAAQRSIPTIALPVASIKRTAGKGNLSKVAMVTAAVRRWGLDRRPEPDEADALWIAETARLGR